MANVFFDITIDGNPAGRITFKVNDRIEDWRYMN
jgi:hypothetical protein